MLHQLSFRIFVFFSLLALASAQVFNFPTSPSSAVNFSGLTASSMRDNDLWQINGMDRSPLETPNGSLSKLDLKAPGKARHAYDKGYQFLMRKDPQHAVEHLTIATLIYPSFVAAHNALGSAYLSLGQPDQARGEFTQAISLDDHLPNSYLNLGCAQLALKDYPGAEKSIEKASSLAPLDLDLLTALAYGQFMNHDYSATIATAQQVHGRQHKNAAMVHLYAAAALDWQDKLPEAQSELETFLREDPKSAAAAQARQMLQQIHEDQIHPRPVARTEFKVAFAPSGDVPTGPAQVPQKIQALIQASKESAQIAEAEAANCPTCATSDSPAAPDGSVEAASALTPNGDITNQPHTGYTFRKSTDEVAVFFAATDRGKSVTSLTGADIGIKDDRKTPAAITGFRNESQLPLRMGLVSTLAHPSPIASSSSRRRPPTSWVRS